MIIAGTGNRPEDCRSEDDVRRRVRDTLKEVNPDTIITGMAAGFDLWFADEARMLGIEVWAARPWSTHSPRVADQELYGNVLAAASKVVVVTSIDRYPGPWVYQKRNEWMVDHATHVMAYWSGKERGGTFNCIQYAKKVKVPVRNVF